MHGNAIAKVLERKPPKIVRQLPAGVAHWAPPGGSMVVSSAGEVYELMQLVPHGQVITLDTIRDALSIRHGTSIACPVSTAIFINLAAQAAEDWRAMGRNDAIAWWRTLKSGGHLNDRYPGGMDRHEAELEGEGHQLQRKNKCAWIEDLDRKEFDLLAAMA